MALSRTCDVCGTSRKISYYRVIVEHVAQDGKAIDGATPLLERITDLCPRHLDLLATRIKARTSPAQERKGGAA